MGKFVWGPLCFAIALCIVTGHALRYPLQIIMSVGHLFGCALYYATSLCELYLNGVSHSRPEPLYFWGYYVGCNAPWIIVPISKSHAAYTPSRQANLQCFVSVIIASSIGAIQAAFRSQQDLLKFLQAVDKGREVAGLKGIGEPKKNR